MIEKIKSTADRILGVVKDCSDPANPILSNVVLGPANNPTGFTSKDELTSVGPFSLNANKLAKFMLNDVGALRNKYKFELNQMCDPNKLAVLFAMQELGWFGRKDLVAYLEQNINDALRDSE